MREMSLLLISGVYIFGFLPVGFRLVPFVSIFPIILNCVTLRNDGCIDGGAGRVSNATAWRRCCPCTFLDGHSGDHLERCTVFLEGAPHLCRWGACMAYAACAGAFSSSSAFRIVFAAASTCSAVSWISWVSIPDQLATYPML